MPVLILSIQTPAARQSWAALQRALSSALLLGIIGEHTRNERARRLVDRFASIMTGILNNIDPQEISAPIQRGVAALYELSSKDPRGKESVVDGVAADPHASSIITPANSDGTLEENSPYSVLNNILWGTANGSLL